MEERTLLPCSKPNILKLPEYKETDNDRFNDLPDAMLLHILSFLDMKEVLDAIFISKRWRYLWVSVPTINIDGSYWEDKKKLFRDFVENVVLRHDESNIYKFKLVNLSQLTDMHQTTKWVSYAVSRQVQELDLNTLSLSPTPSLFCQVKIMKLICVSFPLLPKDYVFNFPVLEYLFLKNCYYGPLKNLTISAPHLKTFLVENFPLAPCCAVKIQSPKLTSFQLNGFMYEDYALDQLSSLVTAEFRVITRKSRMTNEVLIENLRTVLGVLTNAKSLTLSTDVFQTKFTELPNELKEKAISFTNVRSLKLVDWRNNDGIGALAELLGSFPNVETLILDTNQFLDPLQPVVCGRKKGKDWEKQLSFECIFCHLKLIELQNFEGSENESIFLGFLVNNALVLETITIKVTETFRKKIEAFALFTIKLGMLAKASSSAKFILKNMKK